LMGMVCGIRLYVLCWLSDKFSPLLRSAFLLHLCGLS
jgi:hypothetical protein